MPLSAGVATSVAGRRFAVLAILSLALHACGPSIRSSAVKLADQGTSVATAGQSSILETRDSLAPYIEGQFMLAPLTGRPEPTPLMLSNIARISNSLTARAEVMNALAGAYAALSAHASYDAGKEVESAVKNLGSAVNAYAVAVSPAAGAVIGTASWVLSKAAGGLIGHRQAKELKAASAAIRERLVAFRGVLDKELEVHEAIRKEVGENSGRTAAALWAAGLADPGPLIRDQLGSLGLVYKEQALPAALAAMKNQNGSQPGQTRADEFVAAVGTVVRRRAAHRADLQVAIVGDTITGLDGLITAHAKFERGEPMSLEAIAQQLATIRAKVDDLRATSESKTKGN